VTCTRKVDTTFVELQHFLTLCTLYYCIKFSLCICVFDLQNTALHCACYGGHVEAVQLLLEYHADVSLKNTYNQSPLDHAIDNMNSDVVTVMLKNKR